MKRFRFTAFGLFHTYEKPYESNKVRTFVAQLFTPLLHPSTSDLYNCTIKLLSESTMWASA